MIIEEGLIAIGILALIAAMVLLRGKEKTSQPKQQVLHKPVADKQVVDLARPSASVSPRTQLSPFPVPQAPFPVSSGRRQTASLAAPPVSANPQVAFPVPQVPFPVSAGSRETAGLAEPTVLANPQIAFPGQTTTVVAQTPVWEIQSKRTQVELAQPNQAQVAVALNGQLTDKPDQGLPEVQMQSSVSSGVVPIPSLNPASKLLPKSPSIDQQMAELIADTWVLQQQAAEIGRRLNYLSTCIQHSLASTTDEPDANSRGNN